MPSGESRSSTNAAILLSAIGLAIPLYQPKDTTLVWQPYSQQALDDARKAGHPVFIDFTAAWCLSCQVNEKLVLHSSAVQHQFSARNITLLPLPSYSPELNPMENVWEYLRANKLCSLIWDSYEAIVHACKKAWDFLINEPERIRSIGSRDWACVTL